MDHKVQKPAVELIGHDGNALTIVARCTHAARDAGWSPERIAAMRADLLAGSYDQLLAKATEYFDVE